VSGENQEHRIERIRLDRQPLRSGGTSVCSIHLERSRPNNARFELSFVVEQIEHTLWGLAKDLRQAIGRLVVPRVNVDPTAWALREQLAQETQPHDLGQVVDPIRCSQRTEGPKSRQRDRDRQERRIDHAKVRTFEEEHPDDEQRNTDRVLMPVEANDLRYT